MGTRFLYHLIEDAVQGARKAESDNARLGGSATTAVTMRRNGDNRCVGEASG